MAKEIKYIARHLIPVTVTPGKRGDKNKGQAPVKPVVKDIQPGERIMLDPEADDTKFLLANNAIVPAGKDDEGAVTKTKATKAKPAAKPVAPEVADSKGANADDELAAATAEYTELFGKAPVASMKLATMMKKIEEKKAENADDEDEKGLV